MQDFFTIAKTDFLDTFQGAWIFPLLLIVLVFIFWKEKDDMRKLLLGEMCIRDSISTVKMGAQ